MDEEYFHLSPGQTVSEVLSANDRGVVRILLFRFDSAANREYFTVIAV